MQILIKQVTVIDSQSEYNNKTVDLLVKDGIITRIDSVITETADSIIAENNLYISSGWVDVFADYCEPGYEQKETIETGINAAVAGGFTHVLLAPNTEPAVSTKSIIESILHKAKNKAVTIHPMGSATQNAAGKDIAEMLDMLCSNVVAFTDGWKPIQNANLALKVMQYIKAFNGTLVQMPIDTNLSAGGLMNEGINSTKLGMAGIPELAETIFLHRDIELLRYAESCLHITGISTAASVELIRKAKKEGLNISCSVTPYHLALTDDVLNTYNSLYKVSPPLRTETDRKALLLGLADGTIDCIATHHHPQEWDAKTKEYEYASDGMAIQESAFNVLWHYCKNYVSIERLIETLTVLPRLIFKMESQSITVGENACITLFQLKNETVLQSTSVKSKSKNNPFIGNKLSSCVYGIINNGLCVLNRNND